MNNTAADAPEELRPRVATLRDVTGWSMIARSCWLQCYTNSNSSYLVGPLAGKRCPADR